MKSFKHFGFSLIHCLIWVLVLTSSVFAQVYVAPSGLDTNPGSIDSPVRTLTKALTLMGTDSLIYVRGGTYVHSSSITISAVGNAGKYVRIWAYQDEVPVFDFSSMTTSSDGIKLSGTYIHLRGLAMTGAGHNGLNVSGHYNIVDRCSFYDNRNSGFQMGSSGTAYPSNNLIRNCDSYRNYDSATTGANADGYAVKWNIGTGNVFKGCRAYNNSDDGWDLWMAVNSVVIDSCMAFRNGINIWYPDVLVGNNGNGFKLGGSYVATPHTTRNCVAFDNAGDTGRGFDENNNTAGQTLYNCTAFRNTGDNFHFTNTVVSGQHIIKNCLSYKGVVNITSGTRTNNSWQGFTVTNADFQSFDTSLALLPRDSSGYLQTTAFLRLSTGSSMIDAGTNVGLWYYGSAPDLGAYEYTPTIPVYTLTTEAENGDISRSPDKTQFDSAMVVQLNALAYTGYHFTGWSGDASGMDNPLTITMDRNKTITATFAINTYTLTLDTVGSGSVVTTPEQAVYDTGSTVSVEAIPARGYHFTGWSGDASGIENPLSIVMSANQTITANFALNTYSLSVTIEGNGSVLKYPDHSIYDTGTVVILNAIPSPAWRFIGWSGDLAGMKNPDTLIMNGDMNITAAFELDSTTVVLNYNPMWNMISLPVIPFDSSKSALFPEAVSDAFAYQNGYLRTNTLGAGNGYWLKFPTAQTITMPGIIRRIDTVQVHAGWNMIGTITYPLDVYDVIQIPDGNILSAFYTFNGGYAGTDTLYPGVGYWVKVANDGQLIFSQSGAVVKK